MDEFVESHRHPPPFAEMVKLVKAIATSTLLAM